MTFLEKVCLQFEQSKVKYVVVGGYAVALHGAVRGTLDVDIALNWNRRNLERAVAALSEIGLESRLPITAEDVFLYRDEYIRNRNLIAWNFHNPVDPSEQVDLIINFDATGVSVSRKTLASARIPILNLSDLIEMKRTSGRPQDLEDITALEKMQ